MAIYSAPRSTAKEFATIATAYSTPRTPETITRMVGGTPTTVRGKRVSGIFGKRTSGSAASSVNAGLWESASGAGAVIETGAMTITSEGFGATFEPPVTFPAEMYLDAKADVGGDTFELWLQFAEG